ncbi:hypothetical protein [Fervidobacterium thailandense]|uniref:Uncharacterized protein n=1 Tax=Fervidobacterium thailandense TaxID=1008305 RepID=A0A1E3G5H4_9BACT|nr:hypothetical protein [Fervidobacterium thailandense]ODN31400.1 hypothetical protein A4H02_01190 [Fervidobacterium thailandense]
MRKLKSSLLSVALILLGVTLGFAFSVSASGIYNAFTVSSFNLALVYEYPNLAFGINLSDVNERTESYKLGFVNVKRKIDKSYFELLSFVGATNGLVLTLGYENYSIPTTGFERTYYISSYQTLVSEYTKTWISLPSIPFGEGSIGPFALNYEGFRLSKLGDHNVSLNLKRGFALFDTVQLSYLELGSIYSLGFFVFSDKSLEQGITVNLGWDFAENRIVGLLGGRFFIEFDELRFFFGAYGTYLPSASKVKYGIWVRFLSPLAGDLIVQNNVAYFKVRVTFGE